MKKMWRKTGIILLMLSFSLIAFICHYNMTVQAASDTPYTEQIDITDYKTEGSPKPADPDHADWIFAGWFQDAACTKAVNKETATGTQYAKFVPMDILSVKCQIIKGTVPETASTKIRLVSTVDNLKYKEVGFKYQVGQKQERKYTTKTVLRSIIANQGDVACWYKPSDLCEQANYFTTVTLSGIPKTGYGTGIRITPYWITLDGTEVEGVSRYARVEDSFLNIRNVPVRLNSNSEVAVGCLNVNYDTSKYIYYGYDAGTIFDEIHVNVEKDKVYCTGNVSDIADNVTADGMYVNLRFKPVDEKLNEEVTFCVDDADFSSNDETSISMNVSDVTWKVIKESESVQLSELPNYTKQQDIIVDAWLGPKASDESMKDFADCGYDTFHLPSGVFNIHDETNRNAKLDNIFTLAQKNNLKVILANSAFSTAQTTNVLRFAFTNDWVNQTLQKWKDTDTFYGFMVSDETTLDTILIPTWPATEVKAVDYILDEYKEFSKNYPGKYFETVLLGIVNRDADEGTMPYFTDKTKSFDEYMDYYYKNFIQYVPVEERVYSFDAYPFENWYDTGNYLFQGRFVGSLKEIAEEAEKAGANKTVYIQNYKDILNSEMVSYQYYTAMCYGYTHFTTYCYMDMWEEEQYSMSYGGVKQDNYYYFQRAHQKLDSFKTVYSNFASRRVGTMAVAGSQSGSATKSWARTENMETSLPLISSATATQDLMIGSFRDQSGNYGYMLANQMMPTKMDTNTVTINFLGASKVAVWNDGAEMQILDANNGTITLDLASGAGAFLIPMQ